MEEKTKEISVFVIEDSKLQADSIQEVLSRNGFKTEVCHDGGKAFKKLLAEKNDVDLVLVDQYLPIMNGLEIIANLQKERKRYNFVVLTSDQTAETAIKAFKSGVIDYIPKKEGVFEELPEKLRNIYINSIENKKKASYEQELRSQENEYETLIKSQKDGICIVNENEVFLFANPAIENIFEIPKRKTAGLSLEKFVDKNSFELLKYQTQLRKKGIASKYYLDIYTQKGKKRNLLVSGAPRFRDGKFSGSYVIMQDVTRLRETDSIKEKMLEDFKYLSEVFPEMLNIKTEDGVLAFLGNILTERIGNAFVSISRNEKDDTITLTHLFGLENFVLRKFQQISGISLIGKNFKKNILVHHLYERERLELVDIPFSQLMEKNLGIMVAKAMKAIIRIGTSYFIGIKIQNQLEWCIQINMKNKHKIHNVPFVESLVFVAGSVIEKIRFHQALFESRNTARSFLDAPTDSMVLLNQDAIIRDCNKTFAERVGIDRLQLIGTSIINYFPGSAINPIKEKLLAVFESGESSRFHTRINQKDYDFVVYPIKDKSKVKYIVIVARDNTSQFKVIQIQKELEMNRQLELIKDRLLSNLNHELRTPLMGIIGMSDAMINMQGTPTHLIENLNIIKDSANSLLEIFRSLSDFTMLKNEKVGLNKKRFDFVSFMYTMKKLFKPVISESKQNIQIFIDKIEKTEIIADQNKLAQIMTNLISNAVKFSPPNTDINIYCQQTELKKSKLMLKVEVEDFGTGIKNEQKGKIFGFFNVGDDSPSREYDGVGIGLAITKQLVSLMQGEIDFSSSWGKGSKFWFTFEAEVPN